ncbi:MAG: 4Fe-4S ferredoxin iron-sulfur binding protein [Firmicutes bacterium]|nr:4Fe-4S ferredoxin iron-sulfur binding protein [Bacillota bacterium]
MKKLSMDDRLAINKFDSADETPHIIVNCLECKSCTHKACLYACPAERYRLNDMGEVLFDHVGCLECGHCRLVCERLYSSSMGYSWNHPERGRGVIFRQG